MGYSISIDHVLKLIRYKHEGNIELSEIGDAWREIIQLSEFHQLKYNIFADYRKSKFNFSVKDFKIIREFVQRIKHDLDGRKECVIVDNPYNTAISMLFETEFSKNIGFVVKVFSTEEAALEWVVVPN